MTTNHNPILVEPDWLDHQSSPVLLVDARRAPDYHRGHLPGAIHLDSFPYANERTDPEGLRTIQTDWANLFGSAGITPDDTVVFYDAGTENRAPRGAFMLRYLGHRRSYVLHGGFGAWVAADRPLTRLPSTRPPAPGDAFPIRPIKDMIATADEVAARLDDPSVVIFDVREEPEYQGRRRLQWNPRMGHLPSVAFLPWWQLLEEKRRFKDQDALRALLEARGVTPDKEVIIYCQKSHRATNTYLALERLDYPQRRVYIGSFREWSRRKDLPIERERPARRPEPEVAHA